MIDVVSRRCQHPGCVRRPLYAMAGQRAMFCRTHKDPGHTDVVSRRCNFEVSFFFNNSSGSSIVYSYFLEIKWTCFSTTVSTDRPTDRRNTA